MAFSMASVNCQKEGWLLSSQCESWCLHRPPLWEISPELALPHSLPACSSEQYIFCQENWVLPVMPSPLWSSLGAWVVSPVQWGRPWPALSGFKLLSDQILWFVAWPGAALELISFLSAVRFERGGAEARWSPIFSAPCFPVSFYIIRPGRFAWETSEDSVFSCLIF